MVWLVKRWFRHFKASHSLVLYLKIEDVRQDFESAGDISILIFDKILYFLWLGMFQRLSKPGKKGQHFLLNELKSQCIQ